MSRAPKIKSFLMPVAVLLASVALGACGSSSSSSSSPSSSGGSAVSLETGGGPKVNIAKKLNIGLFMVAESNQYQQQVVKGAQAAAQKYGATVTPYDGKFEPSVQINSIQNALQKGEMNAVILHPTSGELLCNTASKQLPAKQIPVVVIAVPVCGHIIATGTESVEPGTLSYVDSSSTSSFLNGWFEATAKLNPGPHTIALVAGPEIIGQTKAINALLKPWEAKHPNLKVKYKIYTNYTTPDALAKTQAALKAHPDVNLIMSVYSPDLTRGVVQALEAEGKAGKIPVADEGGSTYSYEQIKKGNIQFTIPFFPYNIGYAAVKALADAQSGTAPSRFIDDSTVGSAEQPLVITKSNLGAFKPEY
jgi:ribose transport system substrate-binding protein